MVKEEPLAAGVKVESAARPLNGNVRFKKQEVDEKPSHPPPPSTYRDIPLLSTDSGSWLTHLMKFASHARVDPNDATHFVPPLKLNRKTPPRLKLPKPSPGDVVLDKYNKPMVGKDGKPLTWPAPGDSLDRIEEMVASQTVAKGPVADESLIAPGGSGRPPKGKLFKKKVREIHKAADSARKTMKQEHFPWVLEDFETSEEWESVRNPMPNGIRALEEHLHQLKTKPLDENGDVKMEDSATVKAEPSQVKPESNTATSHAPWIGKLEGDSSSEASSLHVLFVFDERDAGGFKVVPVSRMYKFLQKPKHSTMTNDQVELEYQKYQKSKDMDRWALRNRPVASGSITKREDSSAWRNWPEVNRLTLPTGMTFAAGRRRNLMAVHGGELLRDEEDDSAAPGRRVKREDSPGVGYDEMDYEQDFADDEETHDPEADAVEDEEAKELEDRLKREMARANNMGDEETGVEEAIAPEDEDQILTGSGKQMMKIMRALAKRDGNEAYDKDEDGRNPYASDDSEDDEDSYIANPEKALALAREEREKKEREAAKNKGKITPTDESSTPSPSGRQEKKPTLISTLSSSSTTSKRPPGAGHASLAHRATSPTRGASKISSKQISRSSSPNQLRSTSPSRAESQPADSSLAGVKRRTDPTNQGANARVDVKRAKMASGGSRAQSPTGSPPGSKSGSRAGSPGAPRVPANAVEAEIIQLIRDGKIANTSELVQHFRKRLKTEPQIKDQLSAAVRKVAVMDKATNRLKLKDGF